MLNNQRVTEKGICFYVGNGNSQEQYKIFSWNARVASISTE